MVGSKKVPKGLSQGTLGMCPGEIREVNIPSHLGFGDEEKGTKKNLKSLTGLTDFWTIVSVI